MFSNMMNSYKMELSVEEHRRRLAYMRDHTLDQFISYSLVKAILRGWSEVDIDGLPISSTIATFMEHTCDLIAFQK